MYLILSDLTVYIFTPLASPLSFFNSFFLFFIFKCQYDLFISITRPLFGELFLFFFFVSKTSMHYFLCSELSLGRFCMSFYHRVSFLFGWGLCRVNHLLTRAKTNSSVERNYQFFSFSCKLVHCYSSIKIIFG